MPTLPTWVDQQAARLWAPDVSLLTDGRYIMYFTAVKAGTTQHCIGAAYAEALTGPYTSMQRSGSDAPFFCPAETDVTIDPTGFRDEDGSRYVVYKHHMVNKKVHAQHYKWYDDSALSGVSQKSPARSNRCPGQVPYAPTPIMIQQVSEADGVTKVGTATFLIDNNGYEDVGNSESPTLMRAHNGNYVLFFSTGCFEDSTYGTNYAVSTTGVRGPYKRNAAAFLATGLPAGYALSGPGTLSVLNNGHYGVFFSHQPSDMSQRTMRIVEFHIDGTTAVVNSA